MDLARHARDREHVAHVFCCDWTLNQFLLTSAVEQEAYIAERPDQEAWLLRMLLGTTRCRRCGAQRYFDAGIPLCMQCDYL